MESLARENELLKEEISRLRDVLNRHELHSEAAGAAGPTNTHQRHESGAACANPQSLLRLHGMDGHGLSKAQVERYSRQLLLPSFGLEAQRALCSSSILVVGCGGLGSPAALYLAAAGVGG